jgi:hypothetical protein
MVVEQFKKWLLGGVDFVVGSKLSRDLIRYRERSAEVDSPSRSATAPRRGTVRMATINKLAISGVRSFGQENPEVLEYGIVS